jgi:CubicO group peptidase (beta-lactamase class C family)
MALRRGLLTSGLAALLPLPAESQTLPLLQQLMADHRVPGVSVAVIRKGEIAELVALGAEPQTLFQAASISKVIAGQVILRLVDRGELQLDSPVNDVLASWRLQGAFAGRVTSRLLLAHRAGTTVPGFPGYAPGRKLPSLQQILDGTVPANTAPVRAGSPPGEAFLYSGGGTMVLQQVAEDVATVPFAALAADLVLSATGMKRSTFAQPLPVSETGVTTGHDAEGRPLPGRFKLYPELAAAGLWSTAEDLARLGLALAASWREGGLLSRDLARTMAAPVAGGPTGLGVFVQMRAGRPPFLYHYGVNAGFRSVLMVVADGSFGAVVMTNGEGGRGLIPTFLDSVLRPAGYGDFKPWSGRP